MQVKHQPYITPMLAWWFVPLGTYRNILISYMPHTAAWKAKPASTSWVWSTLQARAVGYLWIILLDLLPFLAFMQSPYWTIPCQPQRWHGNKCENMFNSPEQIFPKPPETEPVPSQSGNFSSTPKPRPIMVSSLSKLPYQKTSQKTTAKCLTCTWFSQEIGRWECPRRALTWSSWPGVDFAIRLSGGPGLHWCWMTPKQSLLMWSWDMLFSHESEKNKKMFVIFEWDPALHDYNIMKSFNNLACGWFHF